VNFVCSGTVITNTAVPLFNSLSIITISNTSSKAKRGKKKKNTAVPVLE
jgi:hypothetical protein